MKDGSPKPISKHHVSVAVRAHWQHTWGHAFCMRCDDRLSLQLPDVGCVMIHHHGPKPTPMLAVVMDHGKMNANGRVEVAAAFRHKDDPFQCPHFALACLFHHRWTFAKAPFPSVESHPRGRNQNPR